MKNYFYIIIGIIYFSFYISQKDDSLFIYFFKNYSHGFEIISYITAFFGFLTSIGILSILDNYLDRILKQNKDSHFISTIDRMMNIFKYLISFYTGFYLMVLSPKVELFINKFFYIVVLFIFIFISTDFLNVFFNSQMVRKSKFRNFNKSFFPFLSKVIIIFVWIIGIIMIISNLGYDVSALIAGAGIGGIAIALAAQKSLTNIFGAITILLNRPFKIGDMIILSGTTGTVKDIGLTYLTLIDRLGHQVMIPNEAVLIGKIENLSVRENRRTEFIIGVTYGTSLEKMKEGVKIIESILQRYVDKKTVSEFRVNFNMFSAFSLDISITYFSLINDDLIAYYKQKEEVNLEIKESLTKAKIEIAFPTQELIIKK